MNSDKLFNFNTSCISSFILLLLLSPGCVTNPHKGLDTVHVWTDTDDFTEFYSKSYNKLVKGCYVGSWARSNWEYRLYENQTFWFKSTGHFGYTRSSGQYTISQDTLTLNSIPTDTIEEKSFYTFKNSKYILDSDSCIIELGTGYDYCKVAKNLATHNSRKQLKK